MRRTKASPAAGQLRCEGMNRARGGQSAGDGSAAARVTGRWWLCDRRLPMAAVLLMILAFTYAAPAQSDQPAEDAAAGESSDEAKQQRSLDELLGLEEEEDDTAGVAQREAQEELQRRLTQQEITDAFQEAIVKMHISAEQLDERFNTGLGTQRVQQEVLAKLTELIDEAKKQQCSGSSSSSSSSSASKPQPKPQPGKRSTSQGQRSEGPSSDSEAVEAPPMREGETNTVLEESRTEWGALPQRVRDALNQGRRDKYSSLYEQLTQEYYRRLAEEASSP